MSRFTSSLVKACNLRTFTVLFALWLIVGARPPYWFAELSSYLDRAVFRLGLSVSSIAPPRTLITVVHVPAKEYESWLIDPPGASGLQKILEVLAAPQSATNPKTVFKPRVGLVLERPLRFEESAAEATLLDIQRGRKSTDRFFKETQALLDRRDYLLQQLLSDQVTLALLDTLPIRPQSLELSLSQVTALPDWIKKFGAMSRGDTVAVDGAKSDRSNREANFDLHYLPILLGESSSQYMALRTEDGYQFPTFWSRFPSAMLLDGPSQLVSNRSEQPVWQPISGHGQILAHTVISNADAGFIPIYGSMSGIHSSVRQITLEAAQTMGSIGDWVLIGRNGDERLEQVAQILASIGDHAILTEPWWWTLAQKYQLLLSILLIGLVAPLLSGSGATGLWIVVSLASVGVQVWGQSTSSLWLPSGVVLGFTGIAFLSLAFWRWRTSVDNQVIARADHASLIIAKGLTAKGDLDRALQFTLSCRTSPKVLEQIYQIGLRYEEKGDLTSAANALRALKRRRKRKFKDVNSRLKQLRQQARTLSDEVVPAT